MTGPNLDPERQLALDARAARREAACAAGIDDRFIDRLVDEFYACIRDDALLGPIFAAKIDDWAPHLAQMKRFWRSVLHGSGEYEGRPMPKHIAIPAIDQRHFDRWLALFDRTVRDLAATEDGAAWVQSKAESIAQSLMMGIAIHRDGIVPRSTR